MAYIRLHRKVSTPILGDSLMYSPRTRDTNLILGPLFGGGEASRALGADGQSPKRRSVNVSLDRLPEADERYWQPQKRESFWLKQDAYRDKAFDECCGGDYDCMLRELVHSSSSRGIPILLLQMPSICNKSQTSASRGT
jgi:hypothetical protein